MVDSVITDDCVINLLLDLFALTTQSGVHCLQYMTRFEKIEHSQFQNAVAAHKGSLVYNTVHGHKKKINKKINKKCLQNLKLPLLLTF